MNNDAGGIGISITAEDAGATATLDAFEQKLNACEAAYVKTATAAKEGTTAIGASGKAATEAAGGIGLLGVSLEDIGKHGRTAAMGLEAMNLEAAAGAAKVTAMTEALAGFGAVSGPIMLAVGAFMALATAMGVIKDSIKDAADMQAHMETLGAAVRAQGGDWDSLKDSVEGWLDRESVATGFLRSQLLPALNDLVTAGMDVHDAEIALAVASETARAKHYDLMTVEKALIEAEAGRGQALIRLDTNLKDVIHSHGSLDEVLQILHHDMQGAITQNESYEMTQLRLKATQEAVTETIGKFFLPVMQNVAYAMIDAEKSAEAFGHGVSQVFNGIVQDAHAVVTAIAGVAAAMETIAHGGGLGKASDVLGAAMSSAGNQIGSGSHSIVQGAGNIGWSLGHLHSDQVAQADFGAAVGAHMAGLSNIQLDHNPVMGFTRAGHHGLGHHAGAGHHGGHAAHAKSQGAEFNFKALDDQLKPAKKSVDEFQAALDKLPKTVDGYKQAIAQLTDVVAKETVHQNELVKEQKASKDMYEALLKVYNDFGASLGKHPTKAEKQELADLRAQVAGAKADYDHLTTAVDANSASLQKHQHELQKDSATMQAELDKIAKANEAAYQKMENEARKYADETIKFFEKMGKSGKGIFQDLEDAFKAMIDNMIKKFIESKLTDIFMKFMGGASSSNGQSSSSNPFSFLSFGGGGSSSGPTTINTPSGQAMVVHIGGIDSSITNSSGYTVADNGQYSQTGPAQKYSPGLSNVVAGSAMAYAGYKQGGFSGAMEAGIGAYEATGNPYVAAAAAIIAGLSHHDNPALMPDKYDTANFGQFMANLGTHNDHATSTTDQIANGQHFNIDPNIASSTGGKGEGQYIHDLIAGMTDAQGKAKFGADWDHIKAIFSNWTPGGIQLHDGSWNGFNWQDINSTAQKAMTAAGPASANSPIFTISRTYPDFNASSIGGAGGIGSLPGTRQVGGDGGVGTIQHPAPIVNVTVQGSMIGPGGVADVARAISVELAKLGRGQAFGAAGASRNFGS